MGNLCPPVLGTQKGDASYQTQRFPFEVWEEVRRPERGQLDAQDFHILHILGGNSRNCATGIHNPYWVIVPPSQGPRGAGGDPGSRCPRAPPSLTQGPGAALLDGFVFAPGRVPLQLPQDLFHLGLPRARPPDRESLRRTRLGGRCARPHRAPRPLMNHAASTPRGHVSPAATPVATPAGSGALPSPGTLEAGVSYFAPKRTWGTRLRSKVGFSGWLPAGLRPRAPLIY